MKSVKSYARFLEWFCYIAVIPAMIFVSIYKWFYDKFPWFSNTHSFHASVSYSFFYDMTTRPMLARVLGVAVESVSLGLFLWGILCFVQVLRCSQQGKFFTQKIFLSFRKISRIAFAWALYQPIKGMLESLIVTFHNPPGERVLELSITSYDIINIFLVGFLLVITSLIYEGFKLKQEHELTV